MAATHKQLSQADRRRIARMRAEGRSARQIAAALNRQPSTITREFKRNVGADGSYDPGDAQQQARARRFRGSRLERDADLRERVLELLAAGHSPEQVAERLALEAGRHVISAPSIYRFIHAQIARTGDDRWAGYLPRGKVKRGVRGSRRRSGAG